MYHQESSDTLFVGGRAMIYVLTFSNRGVRDLLVRKEAASSSSSRWSDEETEGLKKKKARVSLELSDTLATRAVRPPEVLGALRFPSKL